MAPSLHCHRRTLQLAAVAFASSCVLTVAPAHAQRVPFGVPWSAGPLHGQISAFAQGDLQFQQGSQSELSDDGRQSLQYDRFVLRRARVIATAETAWARLLLELDANSINGPAVGVQSAEAMVRWFHDLHTDLPTVSLAAGLFRVPFGHQNLLTPREWGFFEPPLFLRALFPGHSDVGARLSGAWRWLRFDLAWTNGHPLGEKNWSLRAPSGPGDFVGRIGLAAHPASFPSEITAGISGLSGTGFHAGNPATADMLLYRDVNQTGAFDPRNVVLVPGQPATPSRTFGRWGAALDVAITARPVRRWQFTLFAEASYAMNLDRGVNVADPVLSGADVREIGWVVGYVQTLFDHLVTGLRIEGYDPNADAFAPQNGRLVPTDQSYFVATFHLAVALDTSTLIGVEYTAIRDHIAIDSAGRPTDLANDLLMLRLQAGF